ncbi:hypothetical protein VOLCADRAFT_100224 [Volvox carteri f. nagariensis]|uniref:Uncharacterized protein n=1 Tax=Volvox carteri f. nagariensis TaxID=3068 RepID=D8UJR3_VOLCA|nr:uncharacterized protein VOLCADRAFT_100224 [Volvox carteri f. nagariensis]EFJ40022.1 hypothetical protein VOLCADRAFT_100224 [Volvox carteri f. nagariensis]|eukprot:XP_002958891.1 hypothetical protein VOLCADRAFT_100224 [Volvox carteri f. nagariensis]
MSVLACLICDLVCGQLLAQGLTGSQTGVPGQGSMDDLSDVILSYIRFQNDGTASDGDREFLDGFPWLLECTDASDDLSIGCCPSSQQDGGNGGIAISSSGYTVGEGLDSDIGPGCYCNVSGKDTGVATAASLLPAALAAVWYSCCHGNNANRNSRIHVSHSTCRCGSRGQIVPQHQCLRQEQLKKLQQLKLPGTLLVLAPHGLVGAANIAFTALAVTTASPGSVRSGTPAGFAASIAAVSCMAFDFSNDAAGTASSRKPVHLPGCQFPVTTTSAAGVAAPAAATADAPAGAASPRGGSSLPQPSGGAVFAISISGVRCTCGTTYNKACKAAGHPHWKVIKYMLAYEVCPAEHTGLAATLYKDFAAGKQKGVETKQVLWVTTEGHVVLWHAWLCQCVHLIPLWRLLQETAFLIKHGDVSSPACVSGQLLAGVLVQRLAFQEGLQRSGSRDVCSKASSEAEVVSEADLQHPSGLGKK